MSTYLDLIGNTILCNFLYAYHWAMTRCITVLIDNLIINLSQRAGISPAIVFIHGNSLSYKIWQKQFESDLLKDYHLIAVDLPGHGSSSHSQNPDKDYNIPAYTLVLKRVIDQLGLKQYILVGFSLGGNIVAEVLPYLPACIGIVLISASIVAKPAALDKAILPNPVVTALFSAHPADNEIKQLMQTYFCDNDSSITDLLFKEFLATDPYCRSYLSKSVMESRHADEIQLLQSVHIPVALIAGQEDKIINNEYFSALPIHKWRDTLHVIPYAGHIPQWENEVKFNELLYEFIQDCSK